MVIKNITLKVIDDKAILSATCKIRKIGWDTVYFSVDKVHQHYIHPDASPFAACLLLPAMRQGEDLVIRGSISKKLYEGMHAVMGEFLKLNTNLRPITIKADKLVADRPHRSRTASFFTGGVDAFYTYLKHKHDRDQKNRIESFILVKGFDVRLWEQKLWDTVCNNIRAVAEAEGVELVIVESNIRELTEPLLNWADFMHGSCLPAVGLFLRNAFSKIYIASSFTAEQQKQLMALGLPMGSGLAFDPLWSTESLTFVHDGSETGRLEKVVSQIAKSATALNHLRVCHYNTEGAYNCGQCDKCLRTMVNLYIAGVLHQAALMPQHIDTQKIAAMRIPLVHCALFHEENLAALRAKNARPDMQQAIQTSLSLSAKTNEKNITSYAKQCTHQLVKAFVYFDHIYLKGTAYAFCDTILPNTPMAIIQSLTDCYPASRLK